MTPRRATLGIRRSPMQANDRVCWACGGAGKCAAGEMYCTRCHLNGRATPWLACTGAGCNVTRKRQFRGEQFFTCPAHQDKK